MLTCIHVCIHTCVVGVMKIGNIVPRVGLEPTSLAFQASVLPLHHVVFSDVTTMPTPTCLCGSLPQVSADYTYIQTYMHTHTNLITIKTIDIVMTNLNTSATLRQPGAANPEAPPGGSGLRMSGGMKETRSARSATSTDPCTTLRADITSVGSNWISTTLHQFIHGHNTPLVTIVDTCPITRLSTVCLFIVIG